MMTYKQLEDLTEMLMRGTGLTGSSDPEEEDRACRAAQRKIDSHYYTFDLDNGADNYRSTDMYFDTLESMFSYAVERLHEAVENREQINGSPVNRVQFFENGERFWLQKNHRLMRELRESGDDIMRYQ